MKDLFLGSFILPYVIIGFVSLACIFVPRNGIMGFKIKYTLSSDSVWRKTHLVFGLSAGVLSLLFVLFANKLEGIIGEGVTMAVYLALFAALSFGSYFYAQRLYFEEFPEADSARVGSAETDVGLTEAFPRRVSGFDAVFAACAFIFSTVLSTMAYVDFLPIWDKKIATHFDILGNPNGFMYAGDCFTDIFAVKAITVAVIFVGGIFFAFVSRQAFLISFGIVRAGAVSLASVWVVCIAGFFYAVDSSIYISNLTNPPALSFSPSVLLFFGISAAAFLTGIGWVIFISVKAARDISVVMRK